MKAAILDAPFKMSVTTLTDPKPGPHNVILNVRAVGISSSDIAIYRGECPGIPHPVVGGRLICGAVSSVGSAVRALPIGQLVVVEPLIGCGTCYPCRIGRSNCCVALRIIGLHQNGGFAEFVSVPARQVHFVPPGLAPAAAAFVEPLAVAIHAVRRAQLQAREFTLILGADPIGLAIAEVAALRGARPLVADASEARLASARTLGLETLNRDETLTEQVLRQTNGEGCPVVFETLGNQQSMELAVELVASAGRIIAVGMAPGGNGVQTPATAIVRKELAILGAHASKNCFHESLQLLGSGRIRLPKISREMNLWDAPDIFAGQCDSSGTLCEVVLIPSRP